MKLIRYVHRTVTQGDWGVSCSTGTGINGAILHLYRSRIGSHELKYDQWMRGFGDGKLFPSTEDASQWAFDHGYLQLYFTDPDLRARRKASATANALHSFRVVPAPTAELCA
jgi:hypothetical protein